MSRTGIGETPPPETAGSARSRITAGDVHDHSFDLPVGPTRHVLLDSQLQETHNRPGPGASSTRAEIDVRHAVVDGYGNNGVAAADVSDPLQKRIRVVVSAGDVMGGLVTVRLKRILAHIQAAIARVDQALRALVRESPGAAPYRDCLPRSHSLSAAELKC